LIFIQTFESQYAKYATTGYLQVLLSTLNRSGYFLLSILNKSYISHSINQRMDSLFIKQERLLAQTSTRIIRIADLPDSFILADNMEFATGKKLPLDRGINLLKKHVRLFLRTKKRYPACRRIPLFIYLYRSRNQQRGLICLKKSFPLLSTKINAGKFSTSIFQIASIPNSGYSTHSMLLILF